MDSPRGEFLLFTCYYAILKSGMKKVKGFTLVEVITAMIVIAIIALAAFEFFVYCQRFIVNADLRLMAVNSARARMENAYWDPNVSSEGAVPITLVPGHVWDRSLNVTAGQGDYEVITVTIEPQ